MGTTLTEGDSGIQPATEEKAVRPLGWGRFLLQLASVAAAYVICAAPPVLLWGSSSAALALSSCTSAAGGLLVAWLWLRRDGAVREAFDLSRPASWPRTLAIGVLATGIVMAIFMAGGPLVRALGADSPDVSLVMDLVTQSPAMLILWIVLVGWGSAAFGEELLWRGFLFDRLLRLPGLRGSVLPALLIQAVLFGLPHIYQGWGGVLVTGTVGLFFGWLRLRLLGNLWALIIAHGLVDTIMLVMGYAQSIGWYAAPELAG